MTLTKVALLSFVTLLTMVNPLAVVPQFVAMTEHLSRVSKARVALQAGVATACVLALFLLAGNYLFKFFGITVPAFQIMGGTIFFMNALRVLVQDESRPRPGGRRAEDEQVIEEAPPDDPSSVAIVPLAIPMLSGPGAITSVMVLVNLHPRWPQKMAIILSIIAVGVVCWIALRLAEPIANMIGPRGRQVFSKVMALLLGAIGVQFVLNGLKPIAIEILRAG